MMEVGIWRRFENLKKLDGGVGMLPKQRIA